MRNFIKRLFGHDKVVALQQQVIALRQQQARIEHSLGALLQHQAQQASGMRQAEFSVTSQWGDDGIIQYLIAQAPLTVPRFIEFGVEDYTESNTRFLLQHNQWQGLVMDGSPRHIDYILNDPISWQYDLTAKAAFITAENINDLLAEAGFTGPVGILHIDIDGNDYWVWNALTVAQPQLAIIEYNHVFGPDRPITVPYNPAFYRMDAHHSGQYGGASLAALHHLATQRGYKLIGVNAAGNNAYFLQNHLAPALPALTPAQAFVEAHFSDTRNDQGKLSRLRGAQKQALIAGMPVVNVITGEKELF